MMYAAVLESGNFTVGDPHAESGLFARDENETGWAHLGWPNVRCFGMDVSPFDPHHITLACGNGVLSTRNGGQSWRVMTNWRVTEVLSIAFDPVRTGHAVAGTAYGAIHTQNNWTTWSDISDGLVARFTQSISAAPDGSGFWAGTENGVYRSIPSDHSSEGHEGSDGAIAGWERDGLIGFAIRQIVTTPSGLQVAATRKQGAWTRQVGGPWTRIRAVPADVTCYAVAVDRSDRNIAVGGYFEGVYASFDGGGSFMHLPELSGRAVHALAFDADGTLWAGTHATGVFEFDRNQHTWRKSGLQSSSIRQILPHSR